MSSEPNSPDGAIAPQQHSEASGLPSHPGPTLRPDASEPTPGFRAGFVSLFHAIGYLFRTPTAWPFACVPPLIATLLLAISTWLSLAIVRPWLEGVLPTPGSTLAQVGVGILAWLATLVSIVLGALIALALTPPLSGPALEKVVAFRERDLAIPERAPQSFWFEMWCGLKAQAFAAMLAIPCLAALWVVELFLPAAVIVTVPLKLLVASLSMAWNLFDYPLTLRGVRMRDRFQLMSRYTRASLGFGAAFAALFFVPCLGILMLPVGVAASTDVVWRLLRSDPSLLPNLPRG